MRDEAGQPPHPPAARDLRARLRSDARAGRLAPGRSRGDARAHGRAPASRDRRRCPPDAARSSTRTACSSRSASRRRRSTPTRASSRTRERSRSRRSACSASTRTSSIRSCSNRKTAFVYIQRFADPRQGGRVHEEGVHRRERLPRGEARVSAGQRRLPGHRLRRHRQQGARRPRDRVRPAARGQARPADDRSRPVRPGDRRRQRHARAAGPRRLLDDRQQDPGERRRGAARDGREVGRQVGDGDRARPAYGRGARDGAGARLQRERLVPRAPVAAHEPCGHGRVRARLGVQARHRGGCAHRRARDAAVDVQAAVLASRSPTSASTTPSSVAPRPSASRRSSRTRRTSARSRSPRSSVRPSS